MGFLLFLIDTLTCWICDLFLFFLCSFCLSSVCSHVCSISFCRWIASERSLVTLSFSFVLCFDWNLLWSEYCGADFCIAFWICRFHYLPDLMLLYFDLYHVGADISILLILAYKMDSNNKLLIQYWSTRGFWYSILVFSRRCNYSLCFACFSRVWLLCVRNSLFSLLILVMLCLQLEDRVGGMIFVFINCSHSCSIGQVSMILLLVFFRC